MSSILQKNLMRPSILLVIFFPEKTLTFPFHTNIFRINPENILCMLRRAVNSYSFSNVRFSNLVCSNQNVYNVFATNGLVKRYNICFYSYITNFVANLLEIEEFSNGLTKLRAFVRLIRNNSDWYARYRRLF